MQKNGKRFLLHSRDPRGGDAGKRLKIDAIVMSASKIKWIAILQKSCIII